MNLREHIAITGGALRSWFIAQTYDCLAVAFLWLVGLLVLGVPLAPLWAFFAGVFQFIPGIGMIFALVAPAVTAAISGGWLKMAYVLILYAVIVIVDGFLLQPFLMKRTARVPVWASILAPLILGSVLSFWGVVLSVPLLAVVFAYRERYRRTHKLAP